MTNTEMQTWLAQRITTFAVRAESAKHALTQLQEGRRHNVVMRCETWAVGVDDTLYEKCAECHLFVEPNEQGDDFALYIHLHRGDEADEKIDESHEARPSGQKANLAAWRAWGPQAMRARFET